MTVTPSFRILGSVVATLALVGGAGIRASGRDQIVVTPTAEAQNLRVESAPQGLVTVLYDLIGNDPRAMVTVVLEVSTDAGDTFDVTPRTTRGDVGPGIVSGMAKRIVWDAGKDVEQVQLERFRYRIVITAAVTPSRGSTPDERPGIAPVSPSRGVVTIVTKPVGAQIALDGRPLGFGPLEIRGISAGQHRVTVSKVGFVEHTQLIQVAAGQSSRIEVPMTASSSAAGGVEAKKGGSAKWLLIGGGAAAAAGGAIAAGGGSGTKATGGTATTTPPTTTPTTPTVPTNRAPTVTCGDVVFGANHVLRATDVGVVSATRYQFSIAAASDLDGDALSYTMTYGNGVTSTGTYSATNNSVTYVYPGAGSYSPSLSVKDARGGEAGCRYPTVVTATVAGEWIGNATTGTVSSRLVLTQSGVNVSGNYYEDVRTAANALQGTLTSNVSGRSDGSMSLTVGGSFSNQLTFILAPTDDLKTYRGTYSYRGRTGTFEMKKSQ